MSIEQRFIYTAGVGMRRPFPRSFFLRFDSIRLQRGMENKTRLAVAKPKACMDVNQAFVVGGPKAPIELARMIASGSPVHAPNAGYREY